MELTDAEAAVPADGTLAADTLLVAAQGGMVIVERFGAMPADAVDHGRVIGLERSLRLA